MLTDTLSRFMLGTGIGLFIWAAWTMRTSKLSPMPEVKKHAKLITNGPYEILRHPMYSAILLITGSLVLEFFTLLRLIAFILLSGILLYKLRYEERLLERHFPEYKTYKKKTSRLIPYVY